MAGRPKGSKNKPKVTKPLVDLDKIEPITPDIPEPTHNVRYELSTVSDWECTGWFKVSPSKEEEFLKTMALAGFKCNKWLGF